MLLNIMYYDLKSEKETSTEGDLNIGPLIITPQQIGIGIVVELLALVPSLLIVQFFRRIRARQQISPLEQAMKKLNPSISFRKKTKKSSIFTFPWWCLYIVYFLSIFIMLISMFFILVRGIEFGDVKTQQWLTSILCGFFSSIFFSQPLKIILLALIFSFFCRNRNADKEEQEYIDEFDLEFNEDDNYHHRSLFNYRIAKKVNRLEKYEVDYARQERLKELRMYSIRREFCLCAIYLVLILLITCSNREQNSFLQVQHLRSYFLNQRSETRDFTRISTIDNYWQWLENYFVGILRAQNWYNQNIPRYLNGYLDDKTNRLIGWATMRQLRVKSSADSYSLFNEENRRFYPEWMLNQTIDNDYSSSIIKAFQYSQSDELDTYIYVGQHATYSGNGYVYEFRGSLTQLKSNLSTLHQLSWIDEKTRAVIIQLTLFNPNTQLFTSVTMLVEFLITGSVYSSARFEPLNFYGMIFDFNLEHLINFLKFISAFTSMIQLISMILYMFLIIYIMYQEIQKLFRLKLKYFRQFWSWIQFGIIICSWINLAIYIWHLKETNRISQLFEQTNGYIYINLQFSVYINDLLLALQGFCCFFGLIKFIDIVSFNPRLRLFTMTLIYSMKELLGFSLMFSIVFMAFISLFYLLFTSSIMECSSLLLTAQMLFEITLMKFDTSELMAADAFLGPVCFCLFVFLVVFVCLSMFLSILNDSFRRARDKQIIDEEKLSSFMWKRFLHWTRLKRPTEDELYEENDRQMRSRYFDPIEHFPDRVDQLFYVLNRLF